MEVICQLEGWIVLQYTPQQLWGGYATEEIKRALMMRGWNADF